MKQSVNLKINSSKQFTWKGITLTKRAAKQMINLISGDSEIKGIRLSVKTSGCAGFSYTMEIVKKSIPDDIIFTHNNVMLIVPLCSMPYIDGTEIDFVDEGLNQIFKFNNPKAQYACGCGESFNVE